jgi:hypothetical protein
MHFHLRAYTTNTPTGNNNSGYRECVYVISAHRATQQMKSQPHRFQAAHQLQQRDMAATVQYRHPFLCFVRDGVNL